jgi:hypothetical protein
MLDVDKSVDTSGEIQSSGSVEILQAVGGILRVRTDDLLNERLILSKRIAGSVKLNCNPLISLVELIRIELTTA